MSDPHERRPAFEPATRLLRPTGYDPTMPRPAAVMAAVLLLALRIFSGTVVLIAAAFAPEAVADIDTLTDDERSAAVVVVVVTAVIVLAVDTVLLRLIWTGRNWARVVVMSVTTLSICAAFAGWWDQGQEITIDVGLVPLGLDVLILLALSSRDAAAYARRREKR
ncbi:MAG: hypothetical protein J0I43_12185 [Microbacterium sp.]|uniref:hypothetical protein n=1 Tax=Microbacterium sp. TaxID=51671 RepID=UPI001ACB1C2C|nr:hypothetical protein [Microbacterium sp.]MBN9178108.1 hypothetical protein [Microbacterium sp.]